MKSYLSLTLLLSALLIDHSYGACPTIVSPSEWGAKSPASTTRMSTPVGFVIIHHTETGTCDSRESCSRILRDIQHDHMNNKSPKWSDIGYNFLIGGDGVVYQGRGWDREGEHTPSHNSRSIGISLIGNFQSARPTERQLTATKNLIDCAASRSKLKSNYKILGHRQVRTVESCPGSTLFSIIKKWPKWSSSTS